MIDEYVEILEVMRELYQELQSVEVIELAEAVEGNGLAVNEEILAEIHYGLVLQSFNCEMFTLIQN